MSFIPTLTIYPISEVLVGALEGIREVPALVALVALGVNFDVTGGRSEDVFVLLQGYFIGVGRRLAHIAVGASTTGSGVASAKVHGVRN